MCFDGWFYLWWFYLRRFKCYTTNFRHFGCVPLSQSKSRFCDRTLYFLFHWRPNQSKIGDQSVFRCSFRPARKSNQSGLSKSKKRLAKRNATFIRIRIMSSNYYYFEWGKVIIFLIINAPNNSKLQHPPYPRANPGHLKFWRLDRSNSRPLGPKWCSNTLPYRRICLSNALPQGRCLLIKDIFFPVCDYARNVDLHKSYWNPKRKLGETMHFSKIIHE